MDNSVVFSVLALILLFLVPATHDTLNPPVSHT